MPDFRPSADLSKIPAVTSAYSSEGGFEEVGAALLEQMMAQQRGQQQGAQQLMVLDVRLAEEYAAGGRGCWSTSALGCHGAVKW